MSPAPHPEAPGGTVADGMGADGTVRVRRVRPGDGTGIARVRLAGWQHAYRGIVPAAYLDAMRPDPEHRERQVRAPAPGSAAYVAETAETAGGEPTIVGWLAAGPARDADAPEGAAEIYGCYVDPGRARLGVGRRLMAAALAETGPGVPVLLWVLKDNRAARRFYENAGFRADGAEQALDRGDPVLDAVREVRYLLPAGARQ